MKHPPWWATLRRKASSQTWSSSPQHQPHLRRSRVTALSSRWAEMMLPVTTLARTRLLWRARSLAASQTCMAGGWKTQAQASPHGRNTGNTAHSWQSRPMARSSFGARTTWRAPQSCRSSTPQMATMYKVEPRVARLPAEVASRLPAGCQVARLPGCQVASGCQRLPAVASKGCQ